MACLYSQEAAAEAARVARGIRGSAENDRDSRLSDDRRTGRGNGYVNFFFLSQLNMFYQCLSLVLIDPIPMLVVHFDL